MICIYLVFKKRWPVSPLPFCWDFKNLQLVGMSLYYLCVCFKSLLHHNAPPHLRKCRRFDACVNTCSHMPSCCQPSTSPWSTAMIGRSACPVTYMETFSGAAKMLTVWAMLANAAEQGKSAYLNCLYSLFYLATQPDMWEFPKSRFSVQ